MPNNNSEFNQGRALEGQFQVDGMLFWDKVIMPNNRNINKQRPVGSDPVDNSTPIFNIDGNSFLRNVQTYISSIFKAQKMAIKVGWIFLFNCMGWISLGINTLLAATGGIDEVKQWVLLVFSCVFACVKVYQIYQNASHKREEVRSKKLENDSLEFDLNMKRFNHH